MIDVDNYEGSYGDYTGNGETDNFFLTKFYRKAADGLTTPEGKARRQANRQAKKDVKIATKAAKVEDKKADTASKTADIETQKTIVNNAIAPDAPAAEGPNYMLYGGIGVAVVIIGVVCFFVFKK